MIMASTHAISGIPSLKTFRHSNSNSPKFPLSSNFWTSYYSHPQFPNSNPNSNFLQLSLSLSSSSMASTVRATSSSASVGTSSSSVVVGESDLLIVGPGVLGRLVAQQWSQNFPGCQIYGKTATTDNHDELINIGITPSVKEAMLPCQFPYVIFCAPPSKSPDYAGDVSREAASSWNGKGSFVFTSSSGLVDCTDNGNCDEETPTVRMGKSPRTDVLLKAENVVLDNGGCVLRLAGLYKADRGAHTYWLKQGKSDLRPGHFVNLIHYEDAASLAIAILKKNLRSRVFLGCDNHPLSRQEIMDLVIQSGKFSGRFEGFTGANDSLGKRLNNSKTRAEIGWEPKYPSFAEFLKIM
ncbi:uncharacterized protein LOC110685971 isoform X1 [Chenopodium quinoa]|uniref:uncharacterized protein LOC110685971 isoform X1 n=1 Tax=Chenopodium quinoa TaxID=63459 RepID=UPI000B78608B|nr:uncharacterized protein LOC110685971 isoform X1 [Chenopodium quinoa]XP_021718219.1 uncharacterized protein LOC110685971 isoform X1 [Chenopodium quinoa]